MSSQKYANPLVLKPRTSPIFISVFSIAYLGAMIVVLPLTWHWILKIMFLLILLLSMFYTLRRKGLAEVTTMIWKEGNDWVLELNKGISYETQLLPSSFMSPWLVVLNFQKAEGQPRRSITLFRDALDGESFRRLRVRLGIDGTGQE